MFVTEHLEGRIQCVDEEFVCINLHLRSCVDIDRPFIEQLFINKLTGTWCNPCFNTSCIHNGKMLYYFDNVSLHSEMQDIVNQYAEMRNMLNLKKLLN